MSSSKTTATNYQQPTSYPKNGILLPLQHFSSTSLESLMDAGSSDSSNNNNNNNKPSSSSSSTDDAIFHIVSNYVEAEKQANHQLMTLVKELFCPLTGNSFEAIIEELETFQRQLSSSTSSSVSNSKHGSFKLNNTNTNTNNKPESATASFRDFIRESESIMSPMSGGGFTNNNNSQKPSFSDHHQGGRFSDLSSSSPTSLSMMDQETLFSNLIGIFKSHAVFVNRVSPPPTSSAKQEDKKPKNDENSNEKSNKTPAISDEVDVGNVLVHTLGIRSFVDANDHHHNDDNNMSSPPLQATQHHQDPNNNNKILASATSTKSNSRLHSRTASSSQQNNNDNDEDEDANNDDDFFDRDNNNNNNNHNRYVSTGQFTSISQAQKVFNNNNSSNRQNQQHFRNFSGVSNLAILRGTTAAAAPTNHQRHLSSRFHARFASVMTASNNFNFVSFPPFIDSFIQESYLFGINFYRRSAPLIIRLIETAVTTPAPAMQSLLIDLAAEEENNSKRSSPLGGNTNHNNSTTFDHYNNNNNSNNNGNNNNNSGEREMFKRLVLKDLQFQSLTNLVLLSEDGDFEHHEPEKGKKNDQAEKDKNKNDPTSIAFRHLQQKHLLSRKLIAAIGNCADDYENRKSSARRKNMINVNSSGNSDKDTTSSNNNNNTSKDRKKTNTVLFSEILTLLPEMDSQLLHQLSSTLKLVQRRSQEREEQEKEEKQEAASSHHHDSSAELLLQAQQHQDGHTNTTDLRSAAAAATTTTFASSHHSSSSSLPLHWLLFLLATPVRSLRRLYTFAQDILSVFATANMNSSTIYSLNPESDMLYLSQLIEKLEIQLLEFDAVNYETCTSILTKNTLRRLDFAVSSSLTLQQAVIASSSSSTKNNSSNHHQDQYTLVPLISDSNKLPPHPQRVLLLRGYVQKKIPGGRHPKILFLFDDVLMYGEDDGNGRIKVTTVLPLIVVSKKTLLLAADDSKGGSDSSANKKKDDEPGFFSRLFGLDSSKDKNENNKAGNKDDTTSTAPSSPLGTGKETLLSSNNNNKNSNDHHHPSSKNQKQPQSQFVFEPYILHVRDVPDDVAAGVVPSAFDQGASTQASDTTATYFRTNAFEVIAKTRSYIFYTPTVTEKDQWLSALRFAMSNARKRAVDNNQKQYDQQDYYEEPSAPIIRDNNKKNDDGDIYSDAVHDHNNNNNQNNKTLNNNNNNTAPSPSSHHSTSASPIPAAAKETCTRLAYLKTGYSSEAEDFKQLSCSTSLEQQRDVKSTSAKARNMVFDGCAVPLTLFPSATTTNPPATTTRASSLNNESSSSMSETASRRLEKLIRSTDARFTAQMCKTISMPHHHHFSLGNTIGSLGGGNTPNFDWTNNTPQKNSAGRNDNNRKNNNTIDDNDQNNNQAVNIDLFNEKRKGSKKEYGNNNDVVITPQRSKTTFKNDDDDDADSAMGSTIREMDEKEDEATELADDLN